MFTGIVQAIGRVAAIRATAQDRDLEVSCPQEITQRLSLGASIALDGVCQTVTKLEPGRFTVHAIAETLRVTTLGSLETGDRLNLEASLGAGDPLGGHFVQGHVDGTAALVGVEPRGESITYRFDAPAPLVSQLVPKGSVAIDGVSLTVGPELGETRFEVYLIPHTLGVTTLGSKRVGDRVNLETDILGKYILRYLSALGAGGSLPDPRGGGISWADLTRSGFASGGGPYEAQHGT